MSYTQLTREQRYQIYALLKGGHNQTQIAAIVTCHKSTISRELRRNRGHKGYRPLQAQQLSYGRRYKSHPQRIGAQTWLQVELWLLQQWSPEQIAGRLKWEQKATVSHEWIYHYIYADKKRGGYLYRQLRSQKKQRKRYTGVTRRAQIPNRVSIDRLVVGSLRRGEGSLARFLASAGEFESLVDSADGVLANGHDIRDRLAPGQLVRVVLVRTDEDDRPLRPREV